MVSLKKPKTKIKNFLGRDFHKKRTPDKISKQKRSAVMSKIRSTGSKFEYEFIQSLKAKTRKPFRLNAKDLRGKPDIVFDKEKICVFLDSDFWHGWQYPRWKHLLKNRFWRNKLEANRARDKKNTRWLINNNWKVIRIWEHNINKNLNNEINKIIIYL